MVITDPDTPTGLSPLLIPPSAVGPVNAQKRAMRIQVLLSMGQDFLTKEESGDLLDRRFYVLTTTHELRNSIRKIFNISGS